MLATNMFFWDWSGAPVLAPSQPAATNFPAGSGKSRSKATSDYQIAPDEYWEQYAEHNRAPETPAPETIAERQTRLNDEIRQILFEQAQLEQLHMEKSSFQQATRNAVSIDELKLYTSHVTQLTNEITKLEETNKARIIRAKSLRFSLYQ